MTEPINITGMSDEQLLALIRSRGGMMTTGETVQDIGKGVKVGGVNAVAGTVGLPGDIEGLATAGANKLNTSEIPIRPPIGLPGSQAVRSQIEQWTGPLEEPKSQLGKTAKTATEFLPAAAFPGGVVRRALNVIGPTVGAELGESLSKGSPYGRVAGTLAGGLAATRGITPTGTTPERTRLANVLAGEGVPLSAGQRTGSKPLQWFEAAAADTPFAAGRAANLNEATQRAFSQAVMRRLGSTTNEIATPDAVRRTVGDISQRFETLSARNTLQPDRQFVNDLTTTAQEYVNSVIPSMRAQGRQNLQGIIQGVTDDIQQAGGQLSGRLYQNTRSRLDKMADGIQQQDAPLANAIRGVRDALDGNMGRSIAPADRAEWALARTQWRNWKALEKAMGGAGSSVAEGFVSPSQLRTAVAGQNRGQYVRGQGTDLGEIARAGEAILKPLPQSGTAPRQAAGQLFSSMAGGMAGGAASGGDPMMTMMGMAAPSIAGGVALSRPVQAYLGNQLLPTTRAELQRRLLAQSLLGRPIVGGPE